MTDDYLVSVILPIYNVEQYLPKCLDSLVNQSFEGYEIVAVDDGSTDTSADILKEYQLRYDNIKLISKGNGGLSSARNKGIKAASGEYICFVDSDDYVEYDFISELYTCSKNNNADAIICSYNRINQQSGEIKLADLNITDPYNKRYDEDYKIFELSPYAWNKMFRRSLINSSGITFPEGKVYEDIPTIFPWLSLAKRISVVDKPLYNYRVNRSGSIMSGSLTKSLDMLDSLASLNAYFKAEGIDAVGMDKLCSLNVRHIMYRLTEFKGCKDKGLKNTFIENSFGLLNEQFPEWRSCSYFNKYKSNIFKKVKKLLMTIKLFWKLY